MLVGENPDFVGENNRMKDHTMATKTTPISSGDRVRLVGFFGTGRATGTVSRVTSRGVWVLTASGGRECWHPADIRRFRKAARG